MTWIVILFAHVVRDVRQAFLCQTRKTGKVFAYCKTGIPKLSLRYSHLHKDTTRQIPKSLFHIPPPTKFQTIVQHARSAMENPPASRPPIRCRIRQRNPIFGRFVPGLESAMFFTRFRLVDRSTCETLGLIHRNTP